MQKTYNRSQIIKKVADDLDATQVDVKKIVTSLESQIVKLGLARGQVRIQGFGMFRFYKRKSTTIKQIRTKKNRLILSLTVVKFIATESFKIAVKGGKTIQGTPSSKPKKKTVAPTKTPEKIEVDPNRISLQSFSYHQRVSKDRFDELLKERLAKSSTKKNSFDKKFLDDTPDGKLILSIFKLAKSKGQDRVNFVFENDITYIFTGKPQELLGKLSNDLCSKFFKNRFDLDNFDIPQERSGLLEYKNINRGIITLSIHSLPTHSGASVSVNFRIK